MALADWLPANLVGTLRSSFRWGKPSAALSVQLKSTAGVLEARNFNDTAYINVRGASPVGNDDFATKGYVTSAATVDIGLSGAGVLVVVDNVGMWWFNRTGITLTLEDVTMWRQQAGTSGSTIGDVELDAGGTGGAFVSVYIPGNRPTILAASGDAAFVQANTFATTAVPNGAILRFNLDQVEAGTPQNILCQITLR